MLWFELSTVDRVDRKEICVNLQNLTFLYFRDEVTRGAKMNAGSGFSGVGTIPCAVSVLARGYQMIELTAEPLPKDTDERESTSTRIPFPEKSEIRP